MMKHITTLSKRFRGLLPVVVDVETAGLLAQTDALLEVAAVTIEMTADGLLKPVQTFCYHIEPFNGARVDPQALEITKIDPKHPFRLAIPEAQAIHRIFSMVRTELEKTMCYRAVLVGHNAWFDLSFILAAAKRSQINPIPFHQFTTIDTASLGAVAYGETVLARAARRARISFDVEKAHSAAYDAERTAELFCQVVNRF